MSGVATAIVSGSIITGYMGAEAQKGAAETAAGAQTEAARMSIAEQQRQFDAIQQLLSPYVEAGGTALTSQMALAGLAGPEAQAAQIAGIEESPIFQSLAAQGEEAILQQGAATGGLRGGDIRGALAQFRPAMLKQEIESQYGKLSGISQMGQASAAGVGAAGLQTGAGVSQSLMAGGQAEAQAALARGAAEAGMWGDIGGGIGMAAGLYQPGTSGVGYSPTPSGVGTGYTPSF